MQKNNPFCVTHRFKNSRMLLTAVLVILLLTMSGCAFLSKATEPTETATEPASNILLTVTAGGETVQPYECVRYSQMWDKQHKNWLIGDGIPVEHQLRNIADTIPGITYTSDFSLHYGENTTLYSISVFHADFSYMLQECTEEQLHTLPEGTYYVSITVNHRGDYVAEGNDYASSSYACVFKMTVT